MKVAIVSLFLPFIFICQTNAQEYIWARNILGVGNSGNHASDLSIDKLGNIYLTGQYSDSTNFDPTNTNFSLNGGPSDIYLARYYPSGALSWAFGLESPSYEWSRNCETDNLNNVIITGTFEDSLDFDPGPGVYNLFSTSYYEPFFAKYDSSGNFIWARSLHTSGGSSWSDNLKIDPENNILLTGSFRDTVDFDASPLSSYNIISNNRDGFLTKYDENGIFKWAINFSASSTCYPRSIVIGEQNAIYLGGLFSGSVDFDPSSSNTILSGSVDAFLAKYDSSGNYIWAKSFGGSSSTHIYSLTVDRSENVYVTGMFKGTVDFDPGTNTFMMTAGPNTSTAFISCFDKFGDFLWAKSYGYGQKWSSSRRIRIDNDGNIFISGYFEGTVDFDPGIQTANLTSNGTDDIFLAKCDSIGNYLWAKQLGKSQSDRPSGLEIDNNNYLYVGGYFWDDSVDFNFGVGEDFLHSRYLISSFVAKYGPCQTSSSVFVSDTICKGEKYFFPNGDSSFIATIDTSVFPSFNGCDSVIITDLSVREVNINVSYNKGELIASQSNESYQWIKCDSSGYNLLSGETSRSYKPIINGEYAVIVIQNGCTDTSECITISNVGIRGNSISNNINIFPNPTSGNLSIDLGKEHPNVTIELTNIQGQLIQTWSFENIDQAQLEIQQPKGIYLLHIKVGQEQSVFRIAKE